MTEQLVTVYNASLGQSRQLIGSLVQDKARLQNEVTLNPKP
jgi:hypothetical protein